MSTKKLLNHRLLSPIALVKRSLANRPEFELANQMKLLNDNKQFKKTLELFDKNKTNGVELSSSFIITQALKACTNLQDLQRGTTIHHLISSSIKNDPYILAIINSSV